MTHPEIRTPVESPRPILEPSVITFGFTQVLMLPTTDADGNDILYMTVVDDIHEDSTPQNFPAGLPLKTVPLAARDMHGDFIVGRQKDCHLTIENDPTVSRQQLAINYDQRTRKFTVRKLGENSKNVELWSIPALVISTDTPTEFPESKARWRQVPVSPFNRLQITISDPRQMSSNSQHRVILSTNHQWQLDRLTQETADAIHIPNSRRPQSVTEDVKIIGDENINSTQKPVITYISLVNNNGTYRPVILSEDDIKRRMDKNGFTDWIAVVTFQGTHYVFDNFKNPRSSVSYKMITPSTERTEHFPLSS